jgi:heme/copper-type cytochrome/quinol oxidase subunit 4
MPFNDEPEDRISLTEVMLGIAVAIIVAPGVIWWALTIWALFQ